jgi:DNA replicative helicase MCM subunit Mcm2 (Cdc46/Mcm family)
LVFILRTSHKRLVPTSWFVPSHGHSLSRANRPVHSQNIEDLTAYISWARNHIHPELTPEASNALVQAYVEMRNAGADARSNDRRITATTRQLESMIRLSEAHARMRYSEKVEVC